MSRAVLAVLVAGVALAALPTRAAGQVLGGPYQFHSLTPCRLADTRNATDPQGGPALVGQHTRYFPVQGKCLVPIGATAVALNVTAVGPNGPGFLSLYPSDKPLPLVSTLNFASGEPALANGAIVPLGPYSATGPTYDLAIYSRIVGPSAGETGGTMHMVLDVTGYFQ